MPGFLRMLHEAGGDLAHFYRMVEAMHKLPKDERHARLQAPANAAGPDRR